MDQASGNIKLIDYLSEFVTPKRLKTFGKVLDNRTRYLTVVLEDLYQAHNASAVLRTCDCFGIQDVHIIENRNTYSINPDVALGSNKWLTLKKSIILCRLTNRLRNSPIRWQLTQPEKTELKLAWLKKSIKKSDILVREFLEKERNK